MVLIIALVSIALLGFSFGASGDVSLTQSQAYWKGTEPLSIGEDSGAYFYVIGSDPDPYEIFYFRIRNSGSYPLRLTKMFGGGAEISTYWKEGATVDNMTSTYIYPGKETCFGEYWLPGQACKARHVLFRLKNASTWEGVLNGADGICGPDGKGEVTINDFGFEFIQYADNLPIVKRQIGEKPLKIKCVGICHGTAAPVYCI
ncbi:TPA: hypothetical protein HA225_06065 [Candidatus Micrarchaeota archaeon]|nr:hypothetical protein [Candidatus Micrarchaeota archaeon]HIH30784.1 hypothetical protein [Candidatus Micrarchaeota archaeon]